MQTLTERLGNSLPTTRTLLRGIPGVYVCDTTTGTCCLVRRDPHKLAPGDIGNRLRQAMVLQHVGNLERFKGQDAMRMHQTSSSLVAEIIAAVGNPLMDVGDDLATSHPCWRAL